MYIHIDQTYLYVFNIFSLYYITLFIPCLSVVLETMMYHLTIFPFESSQRAIRRKATAICVWSSDAGGPLLMSGTFCGGGGSGATKHVTTL